MGLLDTLRQSLGGKRNNKVDDRVEMLSIRGYGVEAVPISPFSATHLHDGTIAFGPPATGGPPRPNVLLAPGREPRQIGLYLADEQDEIYALGSTEDGTTALVLPPGSRDFKGSLSAYRTMPIRAEGWFLRTVVYEMPFPAGFTLNGHATSAHGVEAFDLSDERGALVSIFGPFTGRGRVPPPEEFAPPSSEYADQGTVKHIPESIPWFDFGYRESGRPCQQRLYQWIADPLSYTVYYVRVQAPNDTAKDVFTATDRMVKGFIENER